MKNNIFLKFIAIFWVTFASCTEEFLTLEPRGSEVESGFYETEEEVFQGLVAVYDVLQWNGTEGWTMKLGLLNAASDDCFAGGSSASDQPSWVAYDDFTLNSNLGPQRGLWKKGYFGIYRANLILEKLEEKEEDFSAEFVARTRAEAKFLRAYFYFDLVRFFGNIPLIDAVLSGDLFYEQTQATPAEVYGLIEQDLNDARNTFELPETLPSSELGRITKGAATALLAKAILYQNNTGRMGEVANLFKELIDSGLYGLEANFEDNFLLSNEFNIESIFEVNYSGSHQGGWESFDNGTEGNYDVQFLGMRDYSGPTFANGWSFCPVTTKLVDAMGNDPRAEHTIIDGNKLKDEFGATYTEGFQNTDYFIRKYAGLKEDKALVGTPELNWGYNVKEIRFADVLLMTAEALVRGNGNENEARTYLNMVRSRVGLPSVSASGNDLLEAIYKERQLELATEGHRFFDLVRTGRAQEELGDQGFTSNKNELLPIPQFEIDITGGDMVQNPGY